MRFYRPTTLVSRPRVSVVIPCYIYGGYLPDAVTSALDQVGLDGDVFMADDASPDDSVSVARNLAAADPRVDVLVHDHDAGHIQIHNDGLAKARGDYVVLLSGGGAPRRRRRLDDLRNTRLAGNSHRMALR